MTPYPDNRFMVGDAREQLAELPAESVQCVVTSPPYWGLRDYDIGENSLGQERTPQLYTEHLIHVFAEVHRVLRDDGTLWLNLGDTYAHTGACGGESPVGPRRSRATARTAQRRMGYRIPPGLKRKDLVGVPWRAALALQESGWYLRSDIVWHKPNPMPEAVRDRPTRAHEYLFLLTKSPAYYYNADAVREPARSTTGHRNRHSVWTIPPQRYKGAHFATFPEKLVEPCILAGTPANSRSVVLDPFAGAGTTNLVALRLGRSAIGIELNPEYVKLAEERIRTELTQ